MCYNIKKFIIFLEFGVFSSLCHPLWLHIRSSEHYIITTYHDIFIENNNCIYWTCYDALSCPDTVQPNKCNKYTYWRYIGATCVYSTNNPEVKTHSYYIPLPGLNFNSSHFNYYSTLSILIVAIPFVRMNGSSGNGEVQSSWKADIRKTRTKRSMFPVLPNYHLLPDYFDNWLERRSKKWKGIMPAMRIKDMLIVAISEWKLLCACTACLGSELGNTSLYECLNYSIEPEWASIVNCDVLWAKWNCQLFAMHFHKDCARFYKNKNLSPAVENDMLGSCFISWGEILQIFRIFTHTIVIFCCI